MKFPPKKPDNSHIIKPRVERNWSEYQKNFFKNIARESGHTVVEAYAGAAKTTSLIESLRYIPKGQNALLLAFNKKIQEELQARAPSYVTTLTFHSLGLRAIKQRFGAVEIYDNKVFDIVKSLLEKNVDFDLITNIRDTVAFCKYGLLDTPTQIDKIIDNFGIDICDIDREHFIDLVIQTLALSKLDVSKVDFNDMCWMSYVYNLNLGSFDLVYIDEQQDLNKSQLVMAKKACKPVSGRIIAVGDSYQSLYSWRLADTSIIEDIKNQNNTKILPLPISYRCPKKIIELAKQWVPDIVCPETAIEGEIIDISLNQLFEKVTPGCFVLSRTNAPMIKICFSLIKQGIKANIRGRDVGSGLSYLIKKSKKKKMDAFLKWLSNWKDKEIEKLEAKKANTEFVIDKYECLMNICEDSSSLEDANQKIKSLFNDTDEKNVVMLSTVHRSKGLESDDVFILRWTFRTWFDKMHLLEKPNEEANIAYVSVTRCIKRLFIVSKF